MADVGISFVFKASTAAFTRGVAAANNAVGGLKKSFREFDVGPGFKQLLGVGGVIAGFRATINAAQEMRTEFEALGRTIPQSVRSVADFGDAIESAKRSIADLAITGLSFFTRFGESIGSAINRLRGISAEEERLNDQRARDADRLEKQRDEALRNRSQIERRRAQEREREAKDAEREAMRKAEQDIKYASDLRAAQRELATLEREQARAKMDSAARINDLRKEERDIAKQISELEKLTKDGFELTVDGTRDLIGLKKQQAELQERIAGETERAAKAEKEGAAAVEEQRKTLAAIVGIRGGRQFNDASDEALRESVRRNQAQIQSIGPIRNIGQEFEVARLASEIQNLRQELSFRENLRRDVDALGIEGARRRFGGDPLAFDRLVQQLVQDNRDARQLAAQSNEFLRRIDERQRQGIRVVTLNPTQ